FDALLDQCIALGVRDHTAIGHTVEVCKFDVLRDALVEQQTLGLAVLGDETDARVNGVAGVVNLDLGTVDKDFTFHNRQIAEDGLHDLGASGTHQTADTQYLTGVYREINAVEERFVRQIFHAQHFITDGQVTLREALADGTADHHLNDIVHRDVLDVAGVDVLTVTQDGDAVAQCKDF